MNGRRRSIPARAVSAPPRSVPFCLAKLRSRSRPWRESGKTSFACARPRICGDAAQDHWIPACAGMSGYRRLLLHGAAEISGDLPGAALLGVADLIAAERRDRLPVD